MRNFIFVSPNFPDIYWNFVKALRENGFNVLGIGDGPYIELPEGCKQYLTEYYCCPNMENYENIKKAVAYFEEKYGKIEFLESNNEYWLESDAKLREDFKIETGLTTADINKIKLKSVEHEYFEKSGISMPRFCLPKTEEDIRNFISLVGYPVFAKPDNGVGSQGTFKISNEEDLINFLNKSEYENISYIVEEFVDGDIISFDGICNSKGDVLFSTSNVFYVNNYDIVNNGEDDMYYCTPFPDEKLVNLGTKLVKNLNCKTRFFHIEFFVLKNDHPTLGKKGDYVGIETNMRPAGGYTPDLINFANSVNCYKLYADAIAFDEIKEKMDNTKYYAVTCSRRNKSNYVHSKEEIEAKYSANIVKKGDYPEAISDNMGDYYYFAKFLTLEEVFEFDKFARSKIN